jgi:hypothetical protein
MNKLPTIEIINLIAAIEDSNLLKSKHQCNPNQQIQFVRRTFEQRQVNNRQGVLQVWDMMLAFSEDPEFKKLWDEVMENGENESEE